VSTFEPFQERTEKSFNWVFDVNLKGTFLCINEYYKYQKKYKKGNIINIASIYGLISPDPRIYEENDRKNSEIYGATKAGIIQMTKYFAVHLAENKIRVNAISPGGFLNPDNPQSEKFISNYSHRNPMGRMANSDEILGAIFYLASDASSYTNGHNLIMDGGMSCW
jgi:gluconate 5-dehydrogenase